MVFYICITAILIVGIIILRIGIKIKTVENNNLDKLMSIYNNGFKDKNDLKFFYDCEKEVEKANNINSLFK